MYAFACVYTKTEVEVQVQVEIEIEKIYFKELALIV